MQIILYYREVAAGWFLRLAMWVAPKEMEIYIARGVYSEMKAYAEFLKNNINCKESK